MQTFYSKYLHFKSSSLLSDDPRELSEIYYFFFSSFCAIFFQVMPLSFDKGIFSLQTTTLRLHFPSSFMQYKFSHKQHFAQQHITYECRLPELFIAE